MKELKTTIPLSPSEIATFCEQNAEGTPMSVTFDIGKSKMINEHMLNYLSHLKISCKIDNFDAVFLTDYIATKNFLGNTNLAKHHANVLYFQKYGEPYFYDVLEEFNIDELKTVPYIGSKVIRSLPLFLLVSCDKIEKDERFVRKGLMPFAGVNLAHLIQFPEFLLSYVGDKVFTLDKQSYFEHYYDEFIYGGDKLIQHFLDHPDNLLMNVSEMYHA